MTLPHPGPAPLTTHPEPIVYRCGTSFLLALPYIRPLLNASYRRPVRPRPPKTEPGSLVVNHVRLGSPLQSSVSLGFSRCWPWVLLLSASSLPPSARPMPQLSSAMGFQHFCSFRHALSPIEFSSHHMNGCSSLPSLGVHLTHPSRNRYTHREDAFRSLLA